MTDDEAKRWMAERFAGETIDRVSAFLAMVIDENDRQNLVAASTLAEAWSRHIVDSAQLLALADGEGEWLDVGTGGGFPGVIVALLRSARVRLVEPRRRRADFLRECVERLGLTDRVIVEARSVQQVAAAARVISARAVASVDKLIAAARHCADAQTRWLLPRGRISIAEIDAVQRRWRGMFHMEHSVTDAESIILVLTGAG